MSSGLKRKYNDFGADSSGSSKDKGKPLPPWKQEVRDEKGRRRLHGAFTGGWSAGYFNTVGSKEGWKPATFVSSRAERAEKKVLRPEDYMDDEDLAEDGEEDEEAGENTRAVGSTEAEIMRRMGTVNRNADDSATASSFRDSAGAKILQKMGWHLEQEADYGSEPHFAHIPQEVAVDGAQYSLNLDDEEALDRRFPSKDKGIIPVSRKDNVHGLGYTPSMETEKTESLPEVEASRKAKKEPRLAAGFGLGALNDADDDDVDVYDIPLGTADRAEVAYEDEENVGRSKALNLTAEAKKVPDTSVPQVSRDGRPVLKGFVSSSQPVVQDKWENLEADIEKDEEARAERKRALLTDSQLQRVPIVIETPPDPSQRSVFEYLSQKDKDRIQNLRSAQESGMIGNIILPRAEAPPLGPPPPQVVLPSIHPSIAKAALHGFQPFTSDPVKQSRYTTFLNYIAEGGGEDSSGRIFAGIGPSTGQSVDDFNKELADYAKAATVFKPLSGAMAGRFRTAVIVETGPKVIEGLHQPEASSADTNESEAEEKKAEDPKTNAARMGMYGSLTREVKPWQPAKLLCKRFGVKDPEVDLSTTSEAPTEHNVPTAQQSHPQEPAKGRYQPTGGVPVATQPAVPTEHKSLPSQEANKDPKKDSQASSQPSMSVFNAVFADDDDDEEENEPKATNQKPTIPSAEPAKVAPPLSRPPEVVQVPAPVTPAQVPEPPQTRAAHKPTASSKVVDKVDMGTFKPAFVPRAERESRKNKDGKEHSKKTKSSKPISVSFDDDEEGLQVTIGGPKNREKKKKKKHKERGVPAPGEDTELWVEAPPPEIIQELPDRPPEPVDAPEENRPGEKPAGPAKARSRAIDFM